MATGVFYQSWKEYLAEGANCGSDTFKVKFMWDGAVTWDIES